MTISEDEEPARCIRRDVVCVADDAAGFVGNSDDMAVRVPDDLARVGQSLPSEKSWDWNLEEFDPLGDNYTFASSERVPDRGCA